MSIYLQSSRLLVEIAKPGEPPNTTTRFDRAGFITQVTLDKIHQFCSKEPDNLPHPSTGGYGLCNEFRFPEPASEALLGTQFPKLGIGLLLKDLEGKYVIHHKYPCEAYQIHTEISEQTAQFITEPKPCMGIAVRQTKKISVCDCKITMEIKVENTGARLVEFDEYCHNFITIDRLPIGPDYYLSMPVISQDGRRLKSGIALKPEGNGVGFACYSNEPTLYDIDGESILTDVPFTWQLTHRKSEASVEGSVSVRPSRITVWTIDHIISPEMICHFQIAPGQTAEWSRSWRFLAGEG